MEWFYFIVIAIAIIMLILLLAYIGTRMTGDRPESDTIFPPVKNTCPDLWKADASGKCIIPTDSSGAFDEKQNVGTVASLLGSATYDTTCLTNGTCVPGYTASTGSGTSSVPATIDFNEESWGGQGMSSDCAKSTWVNTNAILWDGVSNYNQC